jgi:hypothetical protein
MIVMSPGIGLENRVAPVTKSAGSDQAQESEKSTSTPDGDKTIQ